MAIASDDVSTKVIPIYSMAIASDDVSTKVIPIYSMVIGDVSTKVIPIYSMVICAVKHYPHKHIQPLKNDVCVGCETYITLRRDT